MAMTLDILTGIMLGLGSLLMLSGVLGVMRFPDFYTRMHAAGVTDTFAAALILLGLMLQADSVITFAKLVMILLFILITSPTASHALAKAAHHSGLKPELGDSDHPRS